MRFGFWPGSNNTWEDTVALCRHAEATGWDGVWYPDHLMPSGSDNRGAIRECWTTVSGLAVAVPRVRIGTLVTSNTVRNPALLAKMAANVDLISGGRLVLGLGAGWQQNEHECYDIPFFTPRERLERLDEAAGIIKSLFRNQRTDIAGTHYTVREAPLSPKPVQQSIPLLIGGGGEKVTLRIVAKHADEWNTWGLPDLIRKKSRILDAYCDQIGRDPATIARSAVAMLVLSDDPAKVERIVSTGRPTIGGSAESVRAIIDDYSRAGVNEVIIPDFNLGRTVEAKKESMDRFMTEVVAAVRV